MDKRFTFNEDAKNYDKTREFNASGYIFLYRLGRFFNDNTYIRK
jgi:hypothetical protein